MSTGTSLANMLPNLITPPNTPPRRPEPNNAEYVDANRDNPPGERSPMLLKFMLDRDLEGGNPDNPAYESLSPEYLLGKQHKSPLGTPRKVTSQGTTR